MTDRLGNFENIVAIIDAREAGASEDEAVFDETLRRLANAKPEKDKKRKSTD